ncbi:hypothetical protein A3F62_05580 [Candidatus Woesebacteria bacterium RIFCSPHIGHO2_12_FULL_44_11]|nr:MAG: hypothetical protein A3F62_05580 [Candidatus Woesebacteria bacterium RIFCSPHIGHO2_12_FULL_44_11]
MKPTEQSLKDIEGQVTGFRFAGLKLSQVFSVGLIYIFVIAGVLLLLYLLSGGFKLMTSAGDPKKIEGGKKIIMNAIIGFVIIFVAYWLVQALGLILNLPGISGPEGFFQ